MSYILEYGKAGSGKSTLAASMTKLGYTVHFLDIDRKLAHMKNLEPLIQSGKITFKEVESKLMESSLRKKATNPKIALAVQPKGYLEIVDYIDKLVEQKEAGLPPPADVFVLDSLTSGIEHFKRLIMHMDPPRPKTTGQMPKLEFDHWSTLLANLEELFTTLQYLHGWFKHIIVICHERQDFERQGDDLILTGILPAIEGSMRDKVGKYFDEVYNVAARQVGKEIHYEVLTRPINKYMARTSRELPAWSEADFSLIFKGERNG